MFVRERICYNNDTAPSKIGVRRQRREEGEVDAVGMVVQD